MRSHFGFVLSVAFLCLLSACGKPARSTPVGAPPPTGQAVAWLDPIHVVTAMRGSEDDYRRCFMRAVEARGIVETEFQVTGEGNVEHLAIVRSTLGRPDVAECLADELRKRHFEVQAGGAKARWTFVFRLTDPIGKREYERRLAAASERDDDEGISIDPASAGRLAPERVEETVLAAYPLFARCYRDAIGRSGRAGGILRLRLVIGDDGRLVEVGDGGTVLPDPYAVDCIAESFYAMRFPSPEGGSVVANYRLEFY